MALPQEKIRPKKPTQVDPTKEYVVGTGGFTRKIGQILSNFNDELECLIGWDVYERMSRDPVVSKNINYQKLSVTSEEINLHPAVGEKDPRYDRALEIRDCCLRSQNNLHRPIQAIIAEMMNALKRSHTVAEITYNEPLPTGPDAYKLTLRSIKVKPHNTTAFVVDPFRNVIGLTAWMYGRAGVVPSSQIDGQKIIEREKFAVLTFETEDEDPRGLNVLRAAYNFWQAKCLVPGLDLKWLEKSGIKSAIGFTAEGLDTNVEEDPDNEGEVISAQQAMANALARLESGSSAAFPHSASVQAYGVDGTGSQFTRAYEDYDKQIDYALSGQSGATKDSETGSYSSKGIFKDVLDLFCYSRKRQVADCLRNDVWKNFVRWNFGEGDVDLTPIVMIGDEEGNTWAETAVALEKLGPSLTDSQWLTLLAELGIPPPEEGEELPQRVKAGPLQQSNSSGSDNVRSDKKSGKPADSTDQADE